MSLQGAASLMSTKLTVSTCVLAVDCAAEVACMLGSGLTADVLGAFVKLALDKPYIN